MKKKLLVSSILIASSLFSNDIDLKQFQELEIIKQSNMIIKKGKSIGDNWYYLDAVSRGKKIGIYTDKEKVIIGRGFYSQTGQEIKFDIDIKKYVDNSLFTVGNGANEFFLFTDPECPYCKMFDEKLSLPGVKDKMKIHTYFYPLEFHILANAMSVSTLAQPKDKRADYASNIMKKEPFEIIKEVDKYTDTFYRDLLKASSDPRYADLVKKYAQAINSAYGTSLESAEDIKTFCSTKIGKLKNSIAQENELLNSLRATSEDFEVTGTPMMFDMQGNKVANPFMLFAKLGIVDIAAIKRIEDIGMTIQMGDENKEKLYIFSSTKCPHCLDSFKDKALMKKLEKYNVHFVLMATGSNPELAQKEAQYIYGIEDKKERFKEFARIMEGGNVEVSKLNAPMSPALENKTALYAKYINETMVQSTPLIIDANGNVKENIK